MKQKTANGIVNAVTIVLYAIGVAVLLFGLTTILIGEFGTTQLQSLFTPTQLHTAVNLLGIPMALAGASLIITGYGLWKRTRWARYTAIIIFLALYIGKIYFFKPDIPSSIILLIILFYLGIQKDIGKTFE